MDDIERMFVELVQDLYSAIHSKTYDGTISQDTAHKLYEFVANKTGVHDNHYGWSESSVECGYQNDEPYWSISTQECID